MDIFVCRKMSVTITKYELSSQMCEFLGIPSGSIMSREKVMKEIRYYMSSKYLCKNNVIIPDEKFGLLMKNLDGPFNLFSLHGYIKHHFIKKIDTVIKYNSIVDNMVNDEQFKEKYLKTMKEMADSIGEEVGYYVHMSKSPEYENDEYDSIYTARNIYDLWLKIDSLYNLYDEMDIDCILYDMEKEHIRDERELNSQILMERLCDYHAVNLEDGEYNWFTRFEQIK
jgi:hypothetical protein